MGEVLSTLASAVLGQLAKHENEANISLKHHCPEILKSVVERSLRCNEQLIVCKGALPVMVVLHE